MNACRYYSTSSGCRFGSECKFSHQPASATWQATIVQAQPLQQYAEQRKCVFAIQNMECPRGLNCPYLHPLVIWTVLQPRPVPFPNKRKIHKNQINHVAATTGAAAYSASEHKTSAVPTTSAHASHTASAPSATTQTNSNSLTNGITSSLPTMNGNHKPLSSSTKWSDIVVKTSA